MLDVTATSGDASVANDTGVGETLSWGMSFVVGASTWPISCCQATAAVLGSTATTSSRSVWMPNADPAAGFMSYSKRATKVTRSPSSAGDETAVRLFVNVPAAGAEASTTVTGQPERTWPVVA